MSRSRRFHSRTLADMDTEENEQLRVDLNKLFAGKVDRALADVSQLDLEPAIFASALSTGLVTILLAQAMAMCEVAKADGVKGVSLKSMVNVVLTGAQSTLLNVLAEGEAEADARRKVKRDKA